MTDQADRFRRVLTEVEKLLVAEGKLIEAGWAGLRSMAVPADAPQVQVDEMRNAFFAGAQHLMSCLMDIMDPGEEPTDADMLRMTQIQDELDAFIADYSAKNMPTKGSA